MSRTSPSMSEPSCYLNLEGSRYSLPERSVGNASSIQDPQDFSERPCVKGIQSPSNSFCDSPRFRSIQQHREDIGLIQPDLCVDPDL